MGSSRNFECVRFVLILGLWERTVFIHCVNYLNFYSLRKLLWLQLHCIFSCTTKMHSAFSWATPRLFFHMIFSDMSEKLVFVESVLLVLWHMAQDYESNANWSVIFTYIIAVFQYFTQHLKEYPEECWMNVLQMVIISPTVLRMLGVWWQGGVLLLKALKTI
jgi:hypothetical protein